MGCPSEVEIGDNLVFSVCTHDPDTGVLTDADAVPDYRVYEDETGTAILTGSMAKLDDANTVGFYSESLACTSGNGFENGKSYSVYIEATVDSDQGGMSYGFKAYDHRKSNVIQAAGTAWGSGAITAASIGADAITSAKIADDAISSEHLNTGALTADAFAADALVAATFATDSIAADALAADAVSEIQSGLATPTNITAGTITTTTNLTNAVTLANGAHGGGAASLTLSDYSNFTGTGSGLTALATGTAQSGTASTIVLAAAATFADDILNGNVIKIHTGTGAGQARVITSNTLADDTCNVTPNWTTNPSSDSQYEIVEGSANVVAMLLDAQSVIDLKDFADAGYDPATNKVQGVVLADTVTTLTGHTAQTADHTAGIADIPTVAEFNARTLVAASYFDPAADTVVNVTNVATLTGHTVQTGDSFARIGAAGAGLTNINLPNQTMDITGDITGNLSGNVTGTIGELAAQAKADVNAEADTALSDYDGPTNAEMEARTPTAAQLVYIVSNAATGMPVTFTTAGGSTTVAVIDEIDGAAGSATSDQYNGRLLVFTDGTLKGVVTDITAYVGSTTTATITAIPFAPTSSHNARLI